MTPRISVCIPAHNHARFFREALESALAQPGSDVEIVVVDDASSDETLAIANDYQSDSRLRLIRNTRRLGLGGNFNRCLEIARGRYVKILCDDDRLYENALAPLADGLDRHPEATFATSAWDVIDDEGSVREVIRASNSSDRAGVLVHLPEIVQHSWLFRNRIGGPSTVLIRRASMDGLGFDARYPQMLDWELWLRLLGRGPAFFVPSVLSAYRRHNATQSVAQWHHAQAASDLLGMSFELAAVTGVEASIPTRAIKRLQVLCLLKSLSSAMKNLGRRDLGLAGHNAALARRALRAVAGVRGRYDPVQA